jgi:hypothetical protein
MSRILLFSISTSGKRVHLHGGAVGDALVVEYPLVVVMNRYTERLFSRVPGR